MNKSRKIYCCDCRKKVDARLTDGKEIYPHREDLYNLPFWKCDNCKNFVGCHHKTKNRVRPLGCIPTKEIKEARKHIHKLLDPIWKSGIIKRNALYNKICQELNYIEYSKHKYHTAQIRSMNEARDVYKILLNIRSNLQFGIDFGLKDCFIEPEELKELLKYYK